MSCEDLLSKLAEGEALLKTIGEPYFSKIIGTAKVANKIQKELKFLRKVKVTEIKKEYIRCSNINTIAQVIHTALTTDNVNEMMATFRGQNGNRLIVDIVADNGRKWVKVILRNPKALHHNHMNGNKSDRPLDTVAQQFLATAHLNSILFNPPKVCFVFVQGVSCTLAECLQSRGVMVEGVTIADDTLGCRDFRSTSDDESDGGETCHASPTRPSPNDVTVNIDVSCLIAYCSNTSNGGAHFQFKEAPLSEQAQMERQTPVKPVIDQYIKGKRLIICRQAVDHFNVILSTIGGEKEQKRGAQFLARCHVVEGVDTYKNELALSGRIKGLSRLVFGTGAAYRAPTITSNHGFVRSSTHQGTAAPALLHQPRALTECKEECVQL